MERDSLSVIVPAFNEERYIGTTLDAINNAISHAQMSKSISVEVVVVDNGSTDETAAIARAKGARVVVACQHNVATARNAGADAALGDLLVFVDADTHWSIGILTRILDVMQNESCVGGAVATAYHPKRLVLRFYLEFWRIIGRLCGMAQGATQFCTAQAFARVRGYNEAVFMGEDVEFHWKLRRLSKAVNGFVFTIEDEKVVPSCRKFDSWPVWKTLLLTNPLTCLLLSRCKSPWREWYSEPIR
ncbi:MAG: glycosyltransferase [Pirellulaceae bacterium]